MQVPETQLENVTYCECLKIWIPGKGGWRLLSCRYILTSCLQTKWKGQKAQKHMWLQKRSSPPQKRPCPAKAHWWQSFFLGNFFIWEGLWLLFFMLTTALRLGESLLHVQTEGGRELDLMMGVELMTWWVHFWAKPRGARPEKQFRI